MAIGCSMRFMLLSYIYTLILPLFIVIVIPFAIWVIIIAAARSLHIVGSFYSPLSKVYDKMEIVLTEYEPVKFDVFWIIFSASMYLVTTKRLSLRLEKLNSNAGPSQIDGILEDYTHDPIYLFLFSSRLYFFGTCASFIFVWILWRISAGKRSHLIRTFMFIQTISIAFASMVFIQNSRK